MILKRGMQHRVLEYYQVCSNIGMVKFGPLCFGMRQKGKTMDFSETIVVYNLKLSTDNGSNKKFLLKSKLCPLGGSKPPATELYACIKMKKCV